MQIFSFISNHYELSLVEVEVSLIPGLPQIHFLGLADKHLRESALRVKTALLACGYRLPRAKQIVVNLRPSFVKKSSHGLDLAIAVAILKATDQLQVDPSWEGQKFIFYGELSLSGKVILPDDLNQMPRANDFGERASDYQIVTAANAKISSSSWQLDNLNEIEKMIRVDVDPNADHEAKARLSDTDLEYLQSIHVTKTQAEVLKLIALSQVNAVLAGAPGVGKSFIADLIYLLRPQPSEQDLQEIRRWNGAEITSSPVFKPHHSSTALGLIGGGIPIAPGILTKAHKGTLILDELLEFSNEVQEALREPLSDGVIRLARAGQTRVYPAKFQCIATTNLCPCGKWVPGASTSCRFSRRRCGSVLERLSGPFVDRFDVLIFLKNKTAQEARDVSFLELRDQCFELKQQAEDFLAQPISDLLKKHNDEMDLFFPGLTLRRKSSLLKVARGLAVMQGKESLDSSCLMQAQEWAILPFLLIEKGM